MAVHADVPPILNSLQTDGPGDRAAGSDQPVIGCESMRRTVIPLCLILGAVGHAPAQSWNGGATPDNRWSTDANWAGGASPYHMAGPSVTLGSMAPADLRNTV